MFLPRVNDRLLLGTEAYFFTEHPAARGMPYGQTGRKATVFQLQDEEGQKRALKVFQAKYRTEENLEKTSDLLRFASMPGLATCERFVISKQQFPSLILQNKDLNYSVLMPWVEGTTWQDVVLNKISLNRDRCYEIASNLNMVLGSMESLGMAHCDLSGPNIILRPRELDDDDEDLVSLIDLEEMYAPKLKRPKTVPAGSAGYAHASTQSGVWSADADRFAGSVLLANMLTWSDSSVVQAAFGEQYFAPNEMQVDCPRYQTLVGSLEKQWGKNTSELFSTAWHSKVLGDCPTFTDWADALSVEIPEIPAPEPEPEPEPVPPMPVPSPSGFTLPPRQTGPIVLSTGSPVRGFKPLFDAQSQAPANTTPPLPRWVEDPLPDPTPRPNPKPDLTQITQPASPTFRSKFKEMERLSKWHEAVQPGGKLSENKLPLSSQKAPKKPTESPQQSTGAGKIVLYVFFGLLALFLLITYIAYLAGS